MLLTAGRRNFCAIIGIDRFFSTMLTFLGAIWAGSASAQQPLQEPPVFTSQNGSLSVLMVAAKLPGVQLGPVTTDLWTYEACYIPSPGANACPAGTGQAGLSGVRLALQPGDKLSIRLVNKLPTVADADHVADNPYLINNPTNLHTHGLIVEPHRAVGPTDTYGDYVFVETTNLANKAVPPGVASVTPVHPGLDVAEGAVQYQYQIDATHPAGLFWFHPHMHGIALNQVTAGLAGIITIGSPSDGCADDACAAAVQQSGIRHLVLKDTQVQNGGVLLTQQDPGFCDGAPAGPRRGLCAGQGPFAGGSWMHTVNGQAYPQVVVGGAGEVWRILNASGSRSYQLSVADAQNGQPLPLQLVAIDGISISVKPGATLLQMLGLLAGKAVPQPCPGVGFSSVSEAICTDAVRMMPSSRVEVRVLRRDNGAQPRTAVFRTAQYDTGDGDLGDHWPAIDLASVILEPRTASVPDQLALLGNAQAALSSAGQLLASALLQVPGTSTVLQALSAVPQVTAPLGGLLAQPNLTQAATAAITPETLVGRVPDPNCRPLAAGHRRRILFGFPSDTAFGLGYVEVDQNGREVEVTRVPIQEFDPVKPVVCVPLPNGNSVQETWELVNLTPEDHNFHIHQTRFYLLAGGAAGGTAIPGTINDAVVLHDNIPLPRPTPPANAAQCDGTLDAVQTGKCKPTTTVVSIPFRELGDFVFHCHILEHEDGGMMARIRVALAPPS
jgi:L-ascorbate oxidase